MRKILLTAVTAVSALAVTAPASAQYARVWAPPVYNYQPYNYGVGFNNHAFAQSMLARVQRIRADIRALDARNILGRGEARSLDMQARNVERNIWRASRYGIGPGEARGIERQIRNLEFRVHREATDWNNRPNRGRRY
jgi:hypothetical protein